MKRLYILFSVLIMSGGLFAQIGPSWWQMLPEDWRTNPYDRDTVSILKIGNDEVDMYGSLAELWEGITAEEIPVENTSNGACNLLNEADFSADVKMFFDENNYYVLFNVNDEDILAGEGGMDRVEMHLAPYVDSCNPGRPIYPAGFEPAGATEEVGDYNFWGRNIPGAEYVCMSYRGSWTEVGAYKTEWLLLSGEDLHPGAPTYTLLGPSKDTLSDVVMGSPAAPFASVYEPKTGGYYFFAIMPDSIFPVEPDPEDFPAMSVAFKVNDKDANDIFCPEGDDNTDPDRYEAWGATTDNNAYWAIAFYGAVGVFDFISISVPDVKAIESNVYYHSGYLRINRNDLVRNISVYNITGALVRSIQSPSDMINISDLVSGVYLVRVSEFNGSSAVTKIVK